MPLVPLTSVATVSYRQTRESLKQVGNAMLADPSEKFMGKIDILVGDRFGHIKPRAALDVIRTL